MKRLLTVFLLNILVLPVSFAKLEALSVLTKLSGKKELQFAGKNSIHKVVSQFKGKGMHEFIIELNVSRMNKAQLTENLMNMGCFTKSKVADEMLEQTNKPKLANKKQSSHLAVNEREENEYLMPEDFLADDKFNDELFESALD